MSKLKPPATNRPRARSIALSLEVCPLEAGRLVSMCVMFILRTVRTRCDKNGRERLVTRFWRRVGGRQPEGSLPGPHACVTSRPVDRPLSRRLSYLAPRQLPVSLHDLCSTLRSIPPPRRVPTSVSMRRLSQRILAECVCVPPRRLALVIRHDAPWFVTHFLRFEAEMSPQT